MARPIVKSRHEMTIDELIQDAGWFPGTERDWHALPLAERDELAFKATGCEVAYATWPAPVNCCHGECQVRRGERKPITLINAQMKYEAECGWWRFIGRTTPQGRRKLAILFRHFRREARKAQLWDIWKLGWQGIVFSGLEI